MRNASAIECERHSSFPGDYSTQIPIQEVRSKVILLVRRIRSQSLPLLTNVGLVVWLAIGFNYTGQICIPGTCRYLPTQYSEGIFPEASYTVREHNGVAAQMVHRIWGAIFSHDVISAPYGPSESDAPEQGIKFYLRFLTGVGPRNVGSASASRRSASWCKTIFTM
jgi:hypothetical protein